MSVEHSDPIRILSDQVEEHESIITISVDVGHEDMFMKALVDTIKNFNEAIEDDENYAGRGDL